MASTARVPEPRRETTIPSAQFRKRSANRDSACGESSAQFGLGVDLTVGSCASALDVAA